MEFWDYLDPLVIFTVVFLHAAASLFRPVFLRNYGIGMHSALPPVPSCPRGFGKISTPALFSSPVYGLPERMAGII